MTDFELKRSIKNISDLTILQTFKEGAKITNEIFNYANFLKQPLEIWMFVPCDEEGNVLEEPKGWLNEECVINDCCTICKCEQYQQAKERVLFDGFKMIGNKHVENNDFVVIGVGFKNGMHKTIEDILKTTNFRKPVTLTETAKKQIYGN